MDFRIVQLSALKKKKYKYFNNHVCFSTILNNIFSVLFFKIKEQTSLVEIISIVRNVLNVKQDTVTLDNLKSASLVKFFCR